MSIYCRFRSAIQIAGAVCIENFSPISILVEDEIDDLGNIPASDLILGKYEIHRLNFTVAIIDIDDERSLFLFHFRNLAIRDGAAGKLEMNVIVASFPAGSGKGSRLALLDFKGQGFEFIVFRRGPLGFFFLASGKCCINGNADGETDELASVEIGIHCVFLLDSVNQRAGERINRRRRAPHRNQLVYRPVQTNRYPTRVRLDYSSSYASSYTS